MHRVVVWSSGGIGSLAIVAVHERADLELVGVWVLTIRPPTSIGLRPRRSPSAPSGSSRAARASV
jgi:hypothetical protein